MKQSPVFEIAALRLHYIENAGKKRTKVIVKTEHEVIGEFFIDPGFMKYLDYKGMAPGELVFLEVPDDSEIKIVRMQIEWEDVWNSSKP